MIFKTFQSDLDGISNKLGFNKRSFSEWSKQISVSFKESEGVINKFKNTLRTAFIAPIEKNTNWIKNGFGEIVSKENIDSFIPKLTTEDSLKLTKQIKEQSIAVTNGSKSWDNYFSVLKSNNQGYIIDLIKNTDDLSKLTGEDLVKANQQARASAIAHNEAIKAQTFSAKAGKVALQALATAGNMLAGWAISKVVQGIIDLATATDRFAESASGIGSTLSNTTSYLSSYKEETKEVWKTINDQSSSIEDTTAARQRLMEIQDELLEKYGDEKDAIKLVTDAVKENSTAFDDFSFSQYQEAMNDFIADNSGFWDKLAYSATGNDSVKESMISTMENYFAGAGKDHLFENLRKQIGADLFDQILDANDVHQIAGAITGNIEDVTTAVYQLQDALAMNKSAMDSSTFEKLNQGLALQATQASELADKYSDLYNQYVLYEKILSDTDNNGYAESLNKITEAYKEYQEAVATGDKEQIQESFNEYATTLQDSLNSTLTDPENGEVIARYFRNMFPTLQEEFSKWQFKIDFDVENGGIKEEVEAYAKEFSNSNEIISFDTRIEHTDDQVEAYNSLIDVAAKYHMEIEQLVAIMEEYGLVASRSKENLINALSGDEQNLVVEDWVNSLTEEEVKLANSTAFDEALERQKKELDGAALSAENYTTALEEVKAQQNEISADEMEVSPLSISETVDQLNTQIKPAFDSLKSAWNDIFTDDGFALDSIDILSTCDSIKSKLDELNKIEGITVDYSAFEDFVKVLNNSESEVGDVEDAFDALATSITQAGLYGTEDFKTMKAALEDLGVVNSEMVAFDALASNAEMLDEALAQANASMDDFIVNTEEGTVEATKAGQAFLEEKVGAENCAEAINILAYHKELCNLQEMNTAEEVANLRTLAENAGYTGEVIQYLTELEQIYQEVASGTLNAFQIGAKVARAAILKTLIDNAANNINYEPKVDFSGATKAAGKAGKDAGKSYKDALKDELNDLNSVISGITGRIDDQISTIKSQKEAAVAAIDAQIDALNEQKSVLEEQKKALEDARDAAVEALEEERDARIKVIEQQQKQLEQQIKLIDQQIKDKEKIIDGINDEIKAMKDANDERQRQIDLQKAQYELERLQHQRTILVN